MHLTAWLLRGAIPLGILVLVIALALAMVVALLVGLFRDW